MLLTSTAAGAAHKRDLTAKALRKKRAKAAKRCEGRLGEEGERGSARRREEYPGGGMIWECMRGGRGGGGSGGWTDYFISADD